jgi:copper(I)-binding protein
VKQLTSLDVPAESSVQIGLSGQNIVFQLTGLTKALFPGTSVPITFSFAKAGSVTVQVPVQLTTLPSGSGEVIPSDTTAG